MSKVDSNFALKVQDMFSSKYLFKQCIQAITLKDNFQYVIVKSNKEVMILQCAIENCKWSLRASCCIHGDRSLWVLTRFDFEHPYSVDVPLTDHRQATFNVIKDLIKNKISLAGSKLSTPKNIVHFICDEHGLSISYQKAWRACKVALDDIRGSLEDSYKMLPRFAYILELNNLGSVVEYKVDADDRFLYFFMALSASISGWQHCCLVIFIDGTSLKNKYGGTLLSASTLDANYQIFPLAFCVVDSKNDSSWTWFCNQMKRIIGGRNEVVIVSNRHKKSSAPGIREELEPIGFAKWSRAYSPRRRYNVMTTNISESLNSAMLKAKELPICSMLEVLRMMLQIWFFERRNEVDYQVTNFTKTIEGTLRDQIERSRSMKVNSVNNMKYQAIDETSQYVIYLPTKHFEFTMKHLSIKLLRGRMTMDIISSGIVGRPKKVRIPSRMKFKRRIKCGRYGRVGHNCKRYF
ncbi:uncharacterized protein LOC103501336 [Cucumis melo]|uniref:Uncharacterized protein LOC103501336 n=1 Tax=Cucumis melo TaxID=3656 RepID=A0A1S3CIV7_CUCME|nr:uncharacterized protein LOC103501336 [Cucumis melo]